MSTSVLNELTSVVIGLEVCFMNTLLLLTVLMLLRSHAIFCYFYFSS